MLEKYSLGCPIWSNREWVGSLFSEDAKPKDFLRQYSGVFNSVEGNSTFYGLPRAETVQIWKVEASPEFRFSFKFPKTISHQHKLLNAEAETLEFFKTLEPLAENLGVFFLQLPPSFDKTGLKQLGRFLRQLPPDFQYAVELRHPDYFDEGEVEKYLHDVLTHYEVNRVMFDTITLHQLKAGDLSTQKAQGKKPKVPPRFVTTAQNPFLRFVGSNDVEPNLSRLRIIAKVVAQWIDEGLHPYCFMHSPNDQLAPELCKAFHQLLGEYLSPEQIGKLPPWPSSEQVDGQLSLF